jgi:hypothetical protein
MLLREPLCRHHVRCGGFQLVLPATDHTAFASHYRREAAAKARSEEERRSLLQLGQNEAINLEASADL